ncbi:MAG: zinc ribbon domain-containing protein [Deltaproteobacteria bacterium]|nr:zinc ribbon domain-containing protein [Deltaproteobacteria bacterium]
MPIYEYKCKSCDKRFEMMQKISDKPLKECIYCSSKKVEKLMSQSSFALKGSGWHKTDYTANKTCGAGAGKKDDKQSPCANCPSAG